MQASGCTLFLVGIVVMFIGAVIDSAWTTVAGVAIVAGQELWSCR